MTKGITRRAMLSTLPAIVAAQTSRSRPKAKQLPSVGEFVRFSDPTTETFVVRLTTLKSSAYLPASANRFVSVKERYLLFSSDRNGTLAPFQVDLHSGVVRQLASPRQLHAPSLCLDPKEQWLYFLDGDSLLRAEMPKKDSWHRPPAREAPFDNGITSFSFTPTGTLFAVRHGDLVMLNPEAPEQVAVWAAGVAATDCLAQPRPHGGCLFTSEASASKKEFWYLAAPSASTKSVLLAKGSVSNPVWSPDGQSLLFLRDVPHGDVMLSEIHSVSLDGAAESCVSPTSQFASFATNFDGSVFVGASRSKAQPNVVLLLRSAKREMTLCQHHASHPLGVGPAFSPDARRVYFASDQEGKPAVYSVNVEMLVEPPGENTEA